MSKEILIATTNRSEDWPKLSRPEVTFAGRSNCGKSSLINALLGGKHARTSSTPGKTILINFYNYTDVITFTDLPGYGYAKVPMKLKSSWGRYIEDYLATREPLKAVFILADVRRGIEEEENDLAKWLRSIGLPFYFIFTKTDKLSPNELTRQKNVITKRIQSLKNKSLANVFYVSVLKKSGIEELKAELNKLGEL